MIGVAGCGQMGLPMLDAFRDAGADAIGFDIAALSHGYVTQDVGDFCCDLRTLVCVVRDHTQIDSLLFQDQALLRRAQDLRRLIICTSLTAAQIRTIRQRTEPGIVIVDAAMSGNPETMRQRQLTFYMGGEDDDIEDVIPLLGTVGAEFHKMGKLGAGMQARHLVQMFTATHAAVGRLAVDWGHWAGIEAEKLGVLLDQVVRDMSMPELMAELSDGHDPNNRAGQLVRDLAGAIEAAPPRSEKALPQTVLNTLRNLQKEP